MKKKHYYETDRVPHNHLGGNFYVYHSLCRMTADIRHIFDSSEVRREVELVDCKICLAILAYKAGLRRGTPAGVISDRLKELDNV